MIENFSKLAYSNEVVNIKISEDIGGSLGYEQPFKCYNLSANIGSGKDNIHIAYFTTFKKISEGDGSGESGYLYYDGGGLPIKHTENGLECGEHGDGFGNGIEFKTQAEVNLFFFFGIGNGYGDFF